MKQKKGPLLSIGIIFRNEIRCLERCLKSLQPVRNAIPCELVMADTGSDDGSREIAEKYADILIDFPWINDFAAARNAVMDRCTGTWYLSIDADEWLDADVSDLVGTLRGSGRRKELAMALTVRNYDTYDMKRSFTDFVASRILRMSTGLRYEGAIHERWNFTGDTAMLFLSKTILHHDGYVFMDAEKMRKKAERNMELLRRELEEKPDNLITRIQYLESGRNEPNYLEVLRETLALIEEKGPKWDMVGPPVYRYAVETACEERLPELDEWVQRAGELFSASVFIRIDVEYLLFCHTFKQNQLEEAIRHGEHYLEAVANKGGLDNLAAQMYSVVKYAAPFWQQHVRILLCAAYADREQLERVPALLENLNYTLLEDSQLDNLCKVLKTLQTKSDMDTSPFITEMWDGINQPEPTPERAEQRKNVFLRAAAPQFSPEYRRNEHDIHRRAYTLFAPLAGKCEPGRAAVILDSRDPADLTEKLSEIEDWNTFPIHALAYALECGAEFPAPNMNLSLEEMDALAQRLSGERDSVISLAIQAAQRDPANHWSGLVWARGLALAAVQCCDWKVLTATVMTGTEQLEVPVTGTKPERKFALARAFAAAEGQFISGCYAPAALREEAIFALPSMHRFGWYCAKAFEALDGGDFAGYVRLLRAGLENRRDMKDMVEFLLEYTPELKAPAPSAELLALAEQVRAVLARFDPDDPAVAMLKQSEAYQKVAYLIEGAEVPVMGGLAQ